MTDPLFWALLIPTAFVGVLVVGAFCIEHLAPRRWRLDDWDRVADRRRRLDRNARNVRAGIR